MNLTFAELSLLEEPALGELCLALAAEFREVDVDAALAVIDGLALALRRDLEGLGLRTPADEVAALVHVMDGFVGPRGSYEAKPDLSMLDLVLERRTGLPILLSVVYELVASRADVPIGGVGLPGHFVVAHFGASPPIVLDPFRGGMLLPGALGPELAERWTPRAIALRMLNNLVRAFKESFRLGDAIKAAELRLLLPAEESARHDMAAELLALRARLN